MTNTPNLELTYVEGSQAQKHVSVNEALRTLDIVVQPTVLDKDLSTPPASPAPGDKYLIAASATGVWAGQENNMAAFIDNGWYFATPKEGWQTYVADETTHYVYDGNNWVELQARATGGTGNLDDYAKLNGEDNLTITKSAAIFTIQTVEETAGTSTLIMKGARGANNPHSYLQFYNNLTTPEVLTTEFQFETIEGFKVSVGKMAVVEEFRTYAGIGINGAAPDATNVLSFNGPAALFNNGGNGIQLKLNKASETDTASFLFQSNFSGRAEIGLTGNDDFTFKVSPDGSTFNDGIVIDKTTGAASFPNSNVGKVTVTTLTAASGSYAAPSDCVALKVTCVGAGGGGAGGETTVGTKYIGTPGGGGGGVCVKYIPNPAGNSYTYAVGLGGTKGSAASPHTSDGEASGGAGGETTFSGPSVAMDANGGGGGNHRLETSGTKEYGGGTGGTSSGGDINLSGGRGGGVIVIGGDRIQGLGYGADRMRGYGGVVNNGNGTNGSGYGSGASGAGMIPGFVLNRDGGTGAPGIIIVEEYY